MDTNPHECFTLSASTGERMASGHGEVSNQTANHAKLRRVEFRNAPILTAKNAENTKNPTAYLSLLALVSED